MAAEPPSPVLQSTEHLPATTCFCVGESGTFRPLNLTLETNASPNFCMQMEQSQESTRGSVSEERLLPFHPNEHTRLNLKWTLRFTDDDPTKQANAVGCLTGIRLVRDAELPK
jgi:hypothetical protein